ncbi:large-conductance mechanosensitive channel [Burkholderia stabilis]|nr:large-conductance mechanosensitive channel [Burkholderia stabilis]
MRGASTLPTTRRNARHAPPCMTGRADARICQSFQDGLPAMGSVRYHAAIGVPPTLIRRNASLRVAARLPSPQPGESRS